MPTSCHVPTGRFPVQKRIRIIPGSPPTYCPSPSKSCAARRRHPLSLYSTAIHGATAKPRPKNSHRRTIEAPNEYKRTAEALADYLLHFQLSQWGMAEDRRCSSAKTLATWKAQLMFFRSHLVLYYLLSSVATAIASLRKSPVPPQGKHTNLLVILTDQQRYDTLRFVQEERGVPEKARIRTPNLDRIAREGGEFMLFSRLTALILLAT